MHSHVTLQLLYALFEHISVHCLPHFCTTSIQYALSNLISIPEGQILKQSFNHHLVHIEWFEYSLDKEITINYTVDHSAIFMFMMLKGHSVFSDHKKVPFTHAYKNYCYLAYNKTGSYHAHLDAGKHEILLLTIKPDWLTVKAQNLLALKPVVENYLTQEHLFYSLPACPVDAGMLKSIKKMLLHNNEDEARLNTVIYSSVDKIINDYHNMLTSKRYVTDLLNQQKAITIANFIKENYADEIVKDVSQLAKKFHVSEKNLLRLTKLAFDMPLHTYVVRIRMLRSLVLLLTATQPIKEIAAMVGYSDPHYFSKAFKKFHAVLPSDVYGLCL